MARKADSAEKVLKDAERRGIQLRLDSDRRTIKWAASDGTYRLGSVPVDLVGRVSEHRWSIVELLLADPSRIDTWRPVISS